MYSRMPMLKCRLRRASAKLGSISQNMSQQRAKIIACRPGREALLVPLQIAREQQAKGMQPVEDEIQRGDTPQPPRMRSRYQGISSGRLPDQMIRNCGEGQVDIQHDEGEAELAQVVLLGDAQDRLDGLALERPNDGEDDKREHRVALPDQELQSVDRRVPGRVERHDPVDRDRGEGDGVDDDAEAAEIFKALLPEGHIVSALARNLGRPPDRAEATICSKPGA